MKACKIAPHQASFVQMINMLSPVFVALAAYKYLKQQLPDNLVTALVLMTGGGVLSISAGAAGSRKTDTPFGAGDLLGIFLALISAGSLAAYMLAVQKTKGLLR